MATYVGKKLKIKKENGDEFILEGESYESKPAQSGGTAVSLVTTGEKAVWNNKANASAIPTKVSQLTNDSGFTTNTGTITGIKMNGASKGTSGVVDLGTVLTAHQDISGKVDKVSGKGLSTEDYTSDEKTKLAGIAEGATANTGTITGIKMNGASKGTSGVVDLGTVITSHQSISGKADKVSSATNGNFAALDANGNLKDSGHKHSDYLTSHQDISGKMNLSLKGAANGVAELDSSGKVPSSQLPSYVDDVLEYETTSAFPLTGESGKIYVATSTNKTYRWSGSTYVEISGGVALGETSSTAYRGDRGKTAYDHAAAKGSAFSSGMYKITTNAQGHVTNADLVTKQDIVDLGIPATNTNTTYSLTQDATDGHKITLTPSSGNPTTITIPDNDTDVRNTAGATDTSSKIYLIGATSQAANPQTYSHDTAYVGTDGCLYSGGKKVLTDSSTLRDVPFGVGTGDWTVSGSNYVATVTTAYVTSTSREWVTFTDTFRSHAKGDISVDKVSGGGGITLTTSAVPTGTIQGTLYIVDADDGKVPVLIEGTVTPIANGGTGQSTLSGAQSSLGITALSDRVDTLNSNLENAAKKQKHFWNINATDGTEYTTVCDVDLRSSVNSVRLAFVQVIHANGVPTGIRIGVKTDYDSEQTKWMKTLEGSAIDLNNGCFIVIDNFEQRLIVQEKISVSSGTFMGNAMIII